MTESILASLRLAVRNGKSRFRHRIDWLRIAMRQGDTALPVYPVKFDEGIKVHIGSGSINVQGWINLDARSFPHTHILSNGVSLDMFADTAISQIYLCHVLEHFSFKEVDEILVSFARKLKSGGRVYISVPDLSAMVNIFTENNNDLSIIKSALMGGQDYEFNFHKAAFTKESLSNSLQAAGFANASTWRVEEVFGREIGDWSSRHIPTPRGPRSISLNLMATKI